MDNNAKALITQQRLSNQILIGDPLSDAAQVVEWFGAVQAQDYAGCLLGVGLRLGNSSVRAVEKAIAARTILRTWPMRGTVHLVPAADAKWMLRTLTPRVIARSAARYRELGLDANTLTRCRDLLIKALQGGKLLPRKQVYAALEAGGISNTKERGSHIIGHWAQEALICVGPHQGKQPTVALLDEFVPHSRDLQGDAAWAELALRYFRSHGPATIQDFCWWTG
ncbi:MAG: winged helix DNA-binding domain-containing protein [Anaerolineae bacterium]